MAAGPGALPLAQSPLPGPVDGGWRSRCFASLRGFTLLIGNGGPGAIAARGHDFFIAESGTSTIHNLPKWLSAASGRERSGAAIIWY